MQKDRLRAARLREHADVFIRMVLARQHVAVAEQRTDGLDGEGRHLCALQPLRRQTDDRAPADADHGGLLFVYIRQQALRHRVMGDVLGFLVRHDNAAAQTVGLAQQLGQRLRLGRERAHTNFYNANASRFVEHTADQRAGDAQYIRDFSLRLVFLIIKVGNSGKPF